MPTLHTISRRSVVVGVALVAAAGAAAVTVPAAATPSNATSKVLVQATVRPFHVISTNRTRSGQPWAALLATYGTSDGYVVQNDFLPGQATGWHSHPGPSLVFVVSGSVTNYASDQPGCAGVTYPAGTTFVDRGGSDVHEIVDTGSGPAETIAVQLIPQGLDRRIDAVTEPANCHV